MNQSQFYDQIPEYISQDKETWNHITCLAYFCQKYQEKHGVQFRIVTGRRGVFTSKEAADFSKLIKLFLPDNYESLSAEKKKEEKTRVIWKVYNYIGWMFGYKFRRGQQSVNGTRIFLSPSIIVEFERMYSGYLAKQKTASKMEQLLSWCKTEIPSIFDIHQLEREEDVKVISKYAEMYALEDTSPERRVILKAKEIGIL